MDDRDYLCAKVKGTKAEGSLNPSWVEWLQGLPTFWTDVDVKNEDLIPFMGWEDDPAERFPTKSASERGPHTHREVVGDRQVKAHKSGATAGMTLETYAKHHPMGNENIPRLTTAKKNRANRLKACGNGVVPYQAAYALYFLLGGE
jgi:hypothetical protein